MELCNSLNYEPEKFYFKFKNSRSPVDIDEARMCTIDNIINSYLTDPVAALKIGLKSALNPEVGDDSSVSADIDEYLLDNDVSSYNITNLDRLEAYSSLNSAIFSRTDGVDSSDISLKNSATPSSSLAAESVDSTQAAGAAHHQPVSTSVAGS